VSVSILYVHGQMDALGDRYTSFCGINDTISCDRVLASDYAKILGIPVAWMALAAYLGMAGLFGAAARTSDDRLRDRLFLLGGAGVLGSLVFSGYMAFLSGAKIGAVCLLCTGLYAVSLLNAVLVFSASRIYRRSGDSPLTLPAAAGILGASIAGVVALAWLTWPSDTTGRFRTADEVRRADPEFAKWYLDLPRVDPSGLLRDDQKAAAAADKVVIVDFFDLECQHCLKNYYLTKALAAARPDEVELVHRHFPLDATCNDIVPQSIHPNACRAAEAVECARTMGKGEEMLDVLFRNQGQLFRENLPRLAGKIGLDKEAFQKCLDEHRTLPLVLADARAGARLEITSTPTVFIGGRRIKGVLEEVGKYEMAVLLEKGATP
jgi:uncharacterized membrane protein/protein-disulfide isomerase